MENYSVIANIVSNTIKFLDSNEKIKSLIIGVSGGIDSALVCAIARVVCNVYNRDIKLIGYSLPILTNKDDEINRAKAVGEAFCHEFIQVDTLIEPYRAFCGTLPDVDEVDIPEKIRLGNVKARLRMMYLYDAAHRNNGIVLSTDNLTEYNLGFWTICGDVGDFGMIQNLWKTEVYALALFMANTYTKEGLENRAEALRMCVNAVPTDGLGITNSDLDQLGAKSYEEVDNILQRYINGAIVVNAYCKVTQRHINSQFKRDWPVNLSRKEILK